ncbi:hypothetical protein LTR95_016367 [Oleoguttula sp. CCFEE 5521]
MNPDDLDEQCLRLPTTFVDGEALDDPLPAAGHAGLGGSSVTRAGLNAQDQDDFAEIVALVTVGIAQLPIPSYGSGDPAQRHALHYYHTTALVDLSGLIPVGFWDRVVPQRCQSERVVRHAVTALSQAHLDFVVQTRKRPEEREHPEPSAQGLEAYSKASKALRRYIEGEKDPSHEAVLTCCLIFNAIEKLHGRSDAALVHMENGLAILNAWQRNSSRARLGAVEHLTEILILFGRLDAGASICNTERKLKLAAKCTETMAGRRSRDPTTERARSLQDVRRNYTRRIPYGVDLWIFIAASGPYRHTSLDLIPSNLQKGKKRLELEHDEIHEELESLLEQYKASKESLSDIPGSEQHNILTVLRMSQLHSLLNRKLLSELHLDHKRPARLRPWDDRPEEFLELGRTLIERRPQWKQSQLLDKSPDFSPEVAITGALLFLAHRTTSARVRAEAVELARQSAIQDGLGDATSTLIDWLTAPDERRPVLLFEIPGH